MTKDWPICFDTCSSTIRATMSPALPAVTVLTTSIDRVGQSSAIAAEFRTNRTTPVTAPHHVRNDIFWSSLAQGFSVRDRPWLARLDARLPNDLCPFRAVRFDLGGERLRAISHRLEAEHLRPVLHVRHDQDLADCAIEPDDGLPRRAGRDHHAEPGAAHDLRIAELRRRGHIRQRSRPRLARHREAAQSALYHLLCSRRRRGEAYLRMSPDR